MWLELNFHRLAIAQLERFTLLTCCLQIVFNTVYVVCPHLGKNLGVLVLVVDLVETQVQVVHRLVESFLRLAFSHMQHFPNRTYHVIDDPLKKGILDLFVGILHVVDITASCRLRLDERNHEEGKIGAEIMLLFSPNKINSNFFIIQWCIYITLQEGCTHRRIQHEPFNTTLRSRIRIEALDMLTG